VTISLVTGGFDSDYYNPPSWSAGTVAWFAFTDWNDPAFCQTKLEELGFTEADFTI